MLYRDCCLTPSSMMACSRQMRLMSPSAASHTMVPTVGLALSNTTNGSHSPDSAEYTRNPSTCDCANIAHALGGTSSDRRSQAERLSVSAPPDINAKNDKESSGSKSPKEPKTSKRSSFAGLFKRNKSTKTSESSEGQDSPDRESVKTKSKKEKKTKSRKSSDTHDSDEEDSPDRDSKKTKNKKDKKSKSRKNSDTDVSDEEAKTSNKKTKKSKKQHQDAEVQKPKRDSKSVSTFIEDIGPCTCGSDSTENLSTKDSKHSHSFWSRKKHTEEKSSKQSLAEEKKESKDSESSHDSGSSSKKSKKSIWNRKKKEKDKKSELKDSDSSSDSGQSGPVDAGTGTAVLSPADVGAGTSTLDSLDGLLCGKFLPISSCPHSSCGSPRPDTLCKSYPCSPRAPKPCPARTLPPCMIKPCPILSKGYCSSKSAVLTPCARKTSPPCGLKPCPAKTLFKPCEISLSGSPSGSPRPCGTKNSSFIPCPESTSSPYTPKPCSAKSLQKPCTRARSSSPFAGLSPCAPKPCPTKSLLKPCSRSQNSSPCRSPSPCGSKLSSGTPCPGSTSSPCDPKPCPATSLFKPCTRSDTPPCGLSSFKLSSLLPCPFNVASPCAQSQPCDPKSPCDKKPPCVSRSPCEPKPFAPKPCPAKTRPCSPSHSPCESPQNSEDNLLNATLSKLSAFLSGPCATSTPCATKPCSAKSFLKPCSRSQDNSPCRSPTLSEDSSLNKTFPCTPKPCPAASAPCTRNPPCIRKTPCAPKPCPKPCNEISPTHSPISSTNSSCVDVCSLNKDPCAQEAPCDSTFNPFDFLKRCVQFLPGSEDLKPLCPQEGCQKGEAVCPTIKEEIDASTSCNRATDNSLLTPVESCEVAGMCDAARAQYYRNRLISTQQILDNKEETIRIQGESLEVAESRLATLMIRAGQLRQELECKSRELRMLRRTMAGCRCKETERTDACTGGEVPPCADLQKHKNVVRTLQTNLSIIEELYRECFYETAKQEALIDKLRQTYLDVRLSDKEKSDEIGRLQNVVNTQKWSLDQCQDLATEVEGLKMEISNFLNSSNNDSGMWERSEDSAATDVGEDLQQITDQLLQLKDLLHQEDPLIAELTNENCRLKCVNTELEGQVGDYQQKVCSLECTIRNHEEVINNLEKEKESAENQLRCAQSQVAALTERVDELECANRCAQEKFTELQCLQEATTQKLEEALAQLCHRECTETQLRAQLEEAQQYAEENERICGSLRALQESVRGWSAQLRDSRARVHALHAELRDARARAHTADTNYRQQVEMTTELQRQLEEAHARGAALCDESRRAVCAVRQWLRDYCAQRREHEEKIKRQQSIICTLTKELEEKRCCCEPATRVPCRAVGCSKCGRAARECERDRERERDRECERDRCGLATCPALHTHAHSETGVCEVASCSSGPVPPRRSLKKKTKACNERCVSRCRSASAQQPEGTCDAATCAAPSSPLPAPAPALPPRCCATHTVHHLRLAGSIGPSVSPTRPRGQSQSPSQELLQRVENLHDALVAGQRRWASGPEGRRQRQRHS